MKQIIALLAFTVAAFAAHADDGFSLAYTLDSFQINANSQLFPLSTNISGGTIAINQQSKELRLTVNRRFNCPPHAMCSMMMPAPIVIDLPITYIGSGFCGGTVVTAVKDLRAEGRGVVTLQLIDDNGNVCERGNVNVKTVQVSVTEQLDNTNDIVSVISGFPAGI